MAESLTPIERKVYNYLLDFLAENTYQPSIREIGKKFRIKSTKTVSDLLQSLAAKGYIERDPSRSRGVRLLGYKGMTGTQPIPYYGRIHAGEFVMIAPSRAPRDGDVIAARLGNEATVKTLTHRDGDPVLVPANPRESE